MKIKNIREYRTFYKNEIRDLTNRDEHFMGTFYQDGESNKTYGWFEIYHGDKEGYGKAEEGIGNFLSSFLDMAKDGQAVYEFLQNAVDAGASHFTMAWGKDEIDGNNYVLIANNGEMFNFDSVRSILNVGSSTKTANSQNIGKFGIGFKLAHRLVGKENGLEELLSDNPSGPVLFSWGNGELAQLAECSQPIPQSIDFETNEKGNYHITDANPWLFKILITCFPALPGNETNSEEIRLSDGIKAKAPVFNQSEYNALSRWVNKYRKYLNDELYNQGSLFFIKLGAGKENDLADNNLSEGVRFSLAILQETAEKKSQQKHTLQTVQLNNGEPILKPTLYYLFFHITKEDNLVDYLYVRFGVNNLNQLTNEQKSKLDRESDIEVLLGFRDYDKMDNYFKGAPNFYLYFPLSEEVHNFNFVIHSNAFYKASSRTFLHKGTVGEDGINERLLRTIARRIETELTDLYESQNSLDKEKFLHLYAALLTSNESTNYERQWVKKPFISELTTVLKKLVPVRSSFTSKEFSLSDLPPKIKTSAIDIPPQAFGLDDVKWFYWGSSMPDIIRQRAVEKLRPVIFDVFQLLIKRDIYTYVNTWIEQDRGRIKTIFNELNIINTEKVRSENFKNNLKNLKIFEFTDGALFSDNELVAKQDEGYIVLHNKLKEIEPEIRKIGIETSRLDLDDFEFYRLYSPYLSPDSQLRSQTKLIEIISNANSELLSPKEKLQVFKVFRDMIEEGKRGERLHELKLFRNVSGQCVRLKSIILNTQSLWLQPYKLHDDEQSMEVDRYLLRDEGLIYERIIYNFWTEIAQNIIAKGKEVRELIFNQIRDFYQKSEYFRDSEKQLSEKGGLFIRNNFQDAENPYYHEDLNKLDVQEYESIQTLVDKEFGFQIPDFDFLTIYSAAPFLLETNEILLDSNQHAFNLQQISNLLSFCTVCDISVFSKHIIYKAENNSYDLIVDSCENYYSDNRVLISYIDKYLNGSLVLLPEELGSFSSIVSYSGDTLYQKLIEELDNNSSEQVVALIEASLSEDDLTLSKLFLKILTLSLDITWGDERKNSIVLKFIKRLLSGEKVEHKDLQNKIVINENGKSINLASIESANDDVLVNYRNGEITLSRSLILGMEDDVAIRKVLTFAQEAVDNQLLTKSEAARIFKIESTSVTDELLGNFESNLIDGQLINSHQLAFVLLEGQINRKDLSRYKIFDANGTWQSLQGNWVLPNISPIENYEKTYVLSNRYNEIKSLIGLQDNDVYYYGDHESGLKEESGNYILPNFLFKRGCSPKVLNSEIDNLDIFKYIHDRWQNTPEEFRTQMITKSWESVLGFDPIYKVYSESVINEEKLEDSIIEWVEASKDEHIKTLEAIGIQTPDSSIVKLRSWLMEEVNEKYPPFMISQILPAFLSHTLIGLAEGFVNQQDIIVFGKDTKKHKIINEIIKQLLEVEDSYEVRFPVWHSKNNICLGSVANEWPKYLSDNDYEILVTQNEGSINEKLISSIQLVVQDEKYNDLIEEYCDHISIIYDIIIPTDAIEHDEPFYKSWNRNHEIKLFRTLQLEYRAYLIIDDEEDKIDLGIVSFGDYLLKGNSDSRHIYYRSEVSLEVLKTALDKSDQSEIAEFLQELILERNKMLAAFYNALTSSGKDDFDDEDSKRLLDSLNEKSLDEERGEIVEEIKSNKRYSYGWFDSYIKYLLSFEEVEDTTSQKSISFQHIENYSVEGKVSEKYIMLRGANSLIPLNVEAFEDFSISIIFKGGIIENIVVEGVSKKGQDLLTYIPQGVAERIRKILNQAVNIKINFSPVLDLVQRLYAAFTDKDIITPWLEIEEALQPIHFIYGPPGTGKTTKLCKILEEEYVINPVFKALILVPTNKAGDVLAKKIILNKSSLSIIRIGSATDPELEELDDEIYQASIDDIVFDSANVIISTIHRLPYYQISQEHGKHYRLYDQSIAWDMVICDESSMISLPYIVFALLSLRPNNPRTKYLIAGDPKQIPPIVDTSDKKLEELDISDESIYKMLNISSFTEDEQDAIKRENDIIENLKTQFRSIEPIGRLYSCFSYDNLLEHGRDYSDMPVIPLPQNFLEELKKPISLINMPLDIDTSVLQPRKLLYSSYHVYAGILTSEIIKHLDNCNEGRSQYSMGIISPYKAQAMLMNKLIISSGISNSIQVQCDTVHGFQGDECDIVIFVVNPNNTYYTGHKNSLLSKEYVYNVAISRARDYLWILNPFIDIKNNPHISNVREILGGEAGIISSHDIEKSLFSEKDFIVNNSYLTGHDNINVFGQVDMKYFIKAGSTAIDIQLRK